MQGRERCRPQMLGSIDCRLNGSSCTSGIATIGQRKPAERTIVSLVDVIDNIDSVH